MPESFIAALRDGRNKNWKKSLIGNVQTSLAYGPMYFNAYPNLQISLTAENSLDALILSIKLHGYNYMPGTEVICICYRIYYKPLHTLNPMCRKMNFKNETILMETNFCRSKVVTRRPIKWNEIDFPKEWILEDAAPPQTDLNEEISEVEQSADSTVRIRFSDTLPLLNRADDLCVATSSRLTRSASSYISPVDYIVRSPSRASTSQIRESTRMNRIRIDNNNIVTVIPDMDPTESEMKFPTGLK